ncbi:MAG: hypothetical protein NTW32_01330 [Chloroflexi bacterium]|nr:hypothetical protein [Chloroflexota bacterium]
MRKVLFLLVFFTIVLAACAPAVPAANAGASQTPADETMVMNATATPGSMTASNPAAAHMMEPITAPDAQPASIDQGGQPLDFRLESGVKVFELTAKAVKWTLTDGVVATAYTYNSTVPGPMIRVPKVTRCG